MFIEEQELQDWHILPNMKNTLRKDKSIQSYWLDEWYDKMKHITFPTVLYYSIDEIPDILPFNKCMVRYEGKSPKDSEFWGPVSTKKELIDVFYTSLRCKTNPGKVYCVRKWEELTHEYRCFWNGTLVAVSSELDIEPPIDQIIEYIKKISYDICYNKCVFDIAHLAKSNELIFVEYNSWESNSGAHRFDWIVDTEVFYLPEYITFRWSTGEKKIPIINFPINETFNENINKVKNSTIINDFSNYIVTKPCVPSNWLVTDKHIYVANDVWLGRFTLDMKPLNWKRGVFRFNNLQLCEDGCIFAEPNYYYYDLTPKKTKSKILNIDYKKNTNLIHNNFKYGFIAINKQGKYIWIRMLDNCTFIFSN